MDIPQRTRVKMCGTTRLEDALAAVRYGVDVLGFIFYPKSPRYIAKEQAGEILSRLPPFINRVGVVVDAPLDELVRIATVGLTFLQLHGKESPEYCRDLRDVLPHCGIIKAFRVGGESRPELMAPYEPYIDAFLLDTYVKGNIGGTGQAFDWSIIEGLKLQRPIILAGGISPENVELALNTVRPYAIDINSGVEVRPGVKDHGRLQELMRIVAENCLR